MFLILCLLKVPYGKTFITLSQITIVNIGQNRCHMECSVEAKFPNGPPFVQGQIKSAMRAGTQQTSVIISENIERYVNLMNDLRSNRKFLVFYQYIQLKCAYFSREEFSL